MCIDPPALFMFLNKLLEYNEIKRVEKCYFKQYETICDEAQEEKDEFAA